ncbi:MAG: hypothetical protein V2I97_22245 [Desulfococcaceae bacterium]|jgi:hypothetical protein|nr:hypothetical protein [Desulfococcaceae bacterium]
MTAALPVSGLPYFATGEPDRANRTGRKDAVLSVTEFVRSAAGPVKFTEKTANTLSALQIGAGLKTVIQKEDSRNIPPPNPVFLLTFFIFFFSLSLFCCIFIYKTDFRFPSAGTWNGDNPQGR